MKQKSLQKASVCCSYDIYPYYSFSMNQDGSIERIYEGYRCIKCGQKTLVRENENKKV